MARLSERVAIVTGAAQGIGGAVARRLATDGARVLVADIDAAGAEANAQAIRDAGGSAESVQCDVGTLEGVQAMIERATQTWGRLDIVVNNAYPNDGLRTSAMETPEDVWDRRMDIGLKAIYRTARLAVPHLRATRGSMVNMSSVHGLLAEPGQMVYETVKTGIIALTRQFALEYAPDGVRVNAVCPGLIITERMAERWQAHPATLRYYAEAYPLRRAGTPDEVAGAVAFLCSDDASFITGHALAVDGGLTIQLQEDLGVRLAKYTLAHADELTWFPT